MRRGLVLATTLISFAVSAELASWKNRPADSQFPAVWSLPTLPSANLLEVVPQQRAIAEERVRRARFTEIDCNAASALSGGHLTCHSGSRIVLARAVKGHSGTGSWSVHVKETTLYIVHGSLGKTDPKTNVPILVSVPFVPTEVYSWAYVDE